VTVDSLRKAEDMAITLTPQTEMRLREKAARDAQDASALAEALLSTLLGDEPETLAENETTEMWAGIQRGDQAAAEGRERPLSEFLADQRAKHGFPTAWPDNPAASSETSHAA